MISDNARALKNALENQVRRLTRKATQLEKRSKHISTLRLIDFVGGLFLIYLAARSGNTWLFGLITAVVIASFIFLIGWHRTIDTAIEQFSGMAKIRGHYVARMALDWDKIPASSPEPVNEQHPFARDFNITGNHSLLQLLDSTSYPGSRAKLKKWLLETEPDVPQIEDRQTLVKELKPMAHFRDRLHLHADMAREKVGDNDWTMNDLLHSLRAEKRGDYTIPLAILGTLSVVNITLLALYLIGIISPYVIVSFIIYLLIYNFYSDRISGLFEEATQIDSLLSRFHSTLLYLENFPYKENKALKKFCNIYHKGEKPSRYLKAIIRIASAASSQGSELTWFLFNSFVPWDLYFAKRLSAYKKDLEPKLTRWLNQFYELEALNALANFGWLNPAYTFSLPAKDRDQTTVFKAENLGHPLIPVHNKVTNNVTINNIGDIHLITGSNMAGKSTFLRTIGINLVLCFTGAPVNATALHTAIFRLFSSINVTDSLNEGLSHFYAEVKRLRNLLDELDQPHAYPLFYMVDEIYRGTNNKERLAGSEAFLKHVADKNGIGLVSTHDLELAQLEDEIATLSNWHFEETIEDGKMHFEYKLKSGPCPSTNALRIMEMEGLPVGIKN